jgi:hypothetical protein
MPEPMHEIGRLRAGPGETDILAVGRQGGDVLIGHPSGWPMRLGAGARDLFMRLWMQAEREAEAWTEAASRVS